MLILLSLLLAQSSGLPTSLAQEPPTQEETEPEFPINIKLWPVLESTRLETGERRTAFWPFFHVTTLPKGAGIHSWHVLNFLSGPNYHMFLPLYYSVDDHLGILPPLFMSGSDYWASLPLLSGSWRHDDGGLSTWVTPLFHVRSDGAGDVRHLHVGPYFQGDDYWAVPPALSWSVTGEDGGRSTWITPLFHSTVDRDGDFVSMHLGPFFRGKDYWALFPAASSWTDEDGSTSTWITPLFHVATDKDGEIERLLAGPYLGGKKWWSIWPLLMGSWDDGESRRFTIGGAFCLRIDDDGLRSASLCPIFTWDRGGDWCVFPLLSGHDEYVTWITPLFHLTMDTDEVESFHVGPYFQGKNYWMVPPALAWHWRYEDDVEALWVTPLFHTTWDSEGEAASSHLFPVYFWDRDNYWAAPPLLSMGWTSENGDRTIWATPLFHRTSDREGTMKSLHVGPYLEGENYWAVPPLLTGSWSDPNGARTTWVTPLFHATTDREGEIDSLHVGPYFQGREYWAVPPLLSWHVRHPDQSETTWLTPAFHLSSDPEGGVESFHVFPAWFWKRDDYWFAPPLLSGGWRQQDGSQSTWITPLFHDTIDDRGDLRSLHVLPLWCWERDGYWAVPPLLIGGGTHADSAQTTWITPMFHLTEDTVGDLESLHLFPLFFWKRDDYWQVPLLLSCGSTRPDGSTRAWYSPLYHEDRARDGTLLSRHLLNYLEGPTYHHIVPLFWDWQTRKGVRHTIFTPPLFVRWEEANGDVTTSFPWPLITARSAATLDRSLCMELRPFLYQDAGEQYEFNFLWRIFSVLRDEEATRVMVGPLWYSTQPNQPGAMTKFQILGGLFARDCNYETERYRYRLLWVIPLGSHPMRE